MTKKAIYLAVFGLLAGSGGVAYVMADEPPADMQAAPAARPIGSPTSAPAHAPAPPESQDQAHRQGMDHGAQQMHDGMMQDHRKGMGGMAPQGGQGGMAMPPGKGCCAGKGMKSSDKPMPMQSDKPMPMQSDKPMPMPADKPMPMNDM